jgi:Tfp pilus assembly protein PilV
MAGRKMILNGKLKGSSVLEVVVAMVIIVIVFGLAMIIYANVTPMSLSGQKIKAQAILQEKLLDVEQERYPAGKSIDTAGLHIEQKIEACNRDTMLNVINLAAYDGNQQKIAVLQKLIPK